MLTLRSSRILRSIPPLVVFCLVSFPAQAKYSGGTGEPNDPYQIATAADLIALGDTPDDYDKHFILTANIDLDPNLPGRKVFDKAVIAPAWWTANTLTGTRFTGTFDGNGHTISHLTIEGKTHLGLLGLLGEWPLLGEVKNLGIVDVNVIGSGKYVGGLVAENWHGNVSQCYSTGSVSGDEDVGGLVGYNDGTVTHCYSAGAVSGAGLVGGLVGKNGGEVTNCYSTGAVSGTGWGVGGLVGRNWGDVTDSNSTGAVSGTGRNVGGLVGYNDGTVTGCYSTSAVSGSESVGGLVGYNDWPSTVSQCYSTGAVSSNYSVGGLVGFNGGSVNNCFWDTQTSGQTTSDGGTGKTTTEMYDPNTFRAEGWDFVGQVDGPHDIWAEPEGGGYPILWWQQSPLPNLPRFTGGTGEPNDPYWISKPEELNIIGHNSRLMKCHFKLVNDLDLSGFRFYPIGEHWLYSYTGVFDGNGKAVRNLGQSLFGCASGLIKDLRLVDPNCIGSPIQSNYGTITSCSVRGGSVSGAGGLVAKNSGNVTVCYSTASVSGTLDVGGLVGYNSSKGSVAHCYSTGAVRATGQYWQYSSVGGLVGQNGGTVTRCYSTGAVRGGKWAGGLVGDNYGDVVAGFWDTQTSGQATSAGGTGKTTAEMQTASTFLDAGWDFVGETANGTEDIWWILEGKDYPRLWWETAPQ